ncbi:pilus assembly PilX family protein [Nitrospira sp. Nam74]
MNERGIALVTIMLVMVIMTVIGIAALTVTGMENRMAGFQRTGEAAATAAESCVGTGVNIIQQTIDQGKVPDSFITLNGGPVLNQTILEGEIMGQSDNSADVPTGSGTANTVQTVGAYTVLGDIDRLYARPRAGGALQFAAGYEGAAGGTAGGGVDIMYRLDCRATTTTSSTASRIVAIYACTATGESCQRRI